MTKPAEKADIAFEAGFCYAGIQIVFILGGVEEGYEEHNKTLRFAY